MTSTHVRIGAMKRYLFILTLLGVIHLHSEIVQPWTTPEQEEAIVNACAQRRASPLSEALPELIQGISDQTFGNEFIDKIAQLEAKKFTGEFVDYWENGQLKIRASFKDGKVDGHVHGWFSDGVEAFKAFYYENIKAGKHLAFYPKGPRRGVMGIARILSYNFDGQLDGEQISKEYSGRLKSSFDYKHGSLDGGKCMYNLDRICIKDEYYKNGKLIPGKGTEKR